MDKKDKELLIDLSRAAGLIQGVVNAIRILGEIDKEGAVKVLKEAKELITKHIPEP